MAHESLPYLEHLRQWHILDHMHIHTQNNIHCLHLLSSSNKFFRDTVLGYQIFQLSRMDDNPTTTKNCDKANQNLN